VRGFTIRFQSSAARAARREDRPCYLTMIFPAMPIPAGVNGGRTTVAPPAPAPAAEADLNLLRVAGPAILKRAAPVIVGLTAAAFIAFRLRARRRRG